MSDRLNRGRRWAVIALTLVGALTLVACTDDGVDGAASPTGTPPSSGATADTSLPGTTAATSATSDPPTTPPPTTAPVPPSTPPPLAPLEGRPDGLGPVSFGAPAETVLAELGALLGSPERDQDLRGCGGGADRALALGTLTVTLGSDALVGYASGIPGAAETVVVRTPEGIGAGSTLAEVRATYPTVQVSEGTLGAEWAVQRPAGTIAGLASGTGDDATVTVLTAGDPCFAR